MAFTKSEKSAMMDGYREMLDRCQAIFVLEYSKMDMTVIDRIHKQAREAGGELHVVKNTGHYFADIAAIQADKAFGLAAGDTALATTPALQCTYFSK